MLIKTESCVVVVTEFSHFKSYNYKFLEAGFIQSGAERLVGRYYGKGRVRSKDELVESQEEIRFTVQGNGTVNSKHPPSWSHY